MFFDGYDSTANLRIMPRQDYKIKEVHPGKMAHSYHPRTWDAEAGGLPQVTGCVTASWVPGEPMLQRHIQIKERGKRNGRWRRAAYPAEEKLFREDMAFDLNLIGPLGFSL